MGRGYLYRWSNEWLNVFGIKWCLATRLAHWFCHVVKAITTAWLLSFVQTGNRITDAIAKSQKRLSWRIFGDAHDNVCSQFLRSQQGLRDAFRSGNDYESGSDEHLNAPGEGTGSFSQRTAAVGNKRKNHPTPLPLDDEDDTECIQDSEELPILT